MRHQKGFLAVVAALAAAGAIMWASPTVAQPCQCDESICSGDGLRKTLVDFTVNQLAGASSWTYEVCSPVLGACQGGAHAGEACSEHEFCQRPKGQTPGDPNATCSRECAVHDNKNLSHLDIVLPGIGECVTDTQQIQIAQLGCPACDPVLSCSASDRDPSCSVSADRVLKCNVAEGYNLDPGECVKLQVTIAGESPTLGAGAVDEVDKAGNTCTTDNICGPACNCAEPSQAACLTRSAGFWGNHPAITQQFLPVTVCSAVNGGTNTLTTTAAATDTASCKMSASEALCTAPGVEANKSCDKNPAYQQLVRQLTAAKLNLKATAANGGNCGADIETVIASCELLCRASQGVISSSGCIQQLDAFNNSVDTFDLTPQPFDNPGPADPTQCQAASGNGWVSGKKCGSFDCR